MTTDNDHIQQKTGERFDLAFDALAQISDLEKQWLDSDNEENARLLLTDGMLLFDRAIEIFTKENQPWMAAWTMLQKASTLADLAGVTDPVLRSELTRQALELSMNGMQIIPDDQPPNLKTITRLYMTVIETLLKIRVLLEKTDQIDALDELIEGISAQFGEVHAWDFSLRSKANDLLFTAQVLDSLVDIEKDPGQRKKMIEASEDLGLQAYDQLKISTAVDLNHVTTLLHGLENKLKSEPVPEGIICTRCGTENPPGRTTCSQCSTQLNEEKQ